MEWHGYRTGERVPLSRIQFPKEQRKYKPYKVAKARSIVDQIWSIGQKNIQEQHQMANTRLHGQKHYVIRCGNLVVEGIQ